MKAIRTAVAIIGVVASIAAVIPGPWQPIAAIVAVAASVVSTGLALIAKKPNSNASGSSTDYKLDPQAGIPYMMGRTYFAGNGVRRDTWGTDNQYQGFTSIYSYGPIKSILEFSVDKAVTTFDGAFNAVGALRNFMWFKYQLGAQPEPVALSSPVAGWPDLDAADKLSGLAASNWVLKFDKAGKKFTSGPPVPGVLVEGVYVYDPRLDSTFPGGSGSCRALVESSYVYSERPALHGLTYALGRFQNGKRRMGVGFPIASIDVQSFVNAANIEDAHDWKIGGLLYSTDNKWNRLKQIGQAGGWQPITLGGRLSCVQSAPRVSIATITSDDLIGKASITAVQGQRERINGMVPRLRLESYGWQVVSADVIRVPAYSIADGGDRTEEFDLEFVQDLAQAAQLTAYEIVNRREFGPCDANLKVRWIGLRPGDCVTVNIPEINLVNQKVVILTRSLDPRNGAVTLQFKSETDGKHPYAMGVVGSLPPVPALTAVDNSVAAAPPAGSWTMIAGQLANASAGSFPVLRFRGTTTNLIADQVIFDYREYGTTEWLSAVVYERSVTVADLATIKPGGTYEGGVRYVIRGVPGERLILGQVSVGVINGITSWGAILDPLGTKPQDNATWGAPNGTPVGTTTAELLQAAVANASAINASQSLTIGQLTTSVADLYYIFNDATQGSTRQAAIASAAAAAASSSAAASLADAQASRQSFLSAQTQNVQATASAAASEASNVQSASNAAIATSQSVLAATLANSTITANPLFAQPGWAGSAGSAGLPPAWFLWSNPLGSFIGKSPSPSIYTGLPSLQIDRNGDNVGVYQDYNIKKGWWVCEFEVAVGDGTSAGVGVFIDGYQFSRAFHIHDEASVDGTTGEKGYGAGSYGQLRKYAFLFNQPSDGASRIYLMAGWANFSSGSGFARTTWHRAVIRLATQAEMQTKQAVYDIAQQASAIAANSAAIASTSGALTLANSNITTAQNAANAAQGTANAASSAASTAQGTATAAGSAASTAQGTATAAGGAASTAQGTANAANSAASTAQAGATAAQSAADYAQSLANAAQGSANYVDSRVTSANAIIASLSATVTQTSGAVATLNTRKGFWNVSAAVGGQTAFIEASAELSPGVYTSDVAIGARKITLYNNSDGLYKPALTVVGGSVILTGGLLAGAFIRLGTGAGWPVALASRDFALSNGEYAYYGTDLSSIPAFTFSTSGLAALNAGETYVLKAYNVTTASFYASLTIQTVPAPVNQSVTGQQASGIASGALQIYKQGLPDASGGYTFNFNVGATGVPPDFHDDTGYNYSVDVQFGLYYYKSGVWYYNSGEIININAVTNTGGAKTLTTGSITRYVNMPAGVEYFGVHCGSASGGAPGTFAFYSVSWQSPGAGTGTRSATPNGEKCIITVRPQ